MRAFVESCEFFRLILGTKNFNNGWKEKICYKNDFMLSFCIAKFFGADTLGNEKGWELMGLHGSEICRMKPNLALNIPFPTISGFEWRSLKL